MLGIYRYSRIQRSESRPIVEVRINSGRKRGARRALVVRERVKDGPFTHSAILGMLLGVFLARARGQSTGQVRRSDHLRIN